MSLTGNAKAKETLRGKINGLKTIHGYSAYEVAVVEGFRGTEEEWLQSLKGEQGEQGIRGERGIQVSYDETTQTLHITGGEEGSEGAYVVSIEQTKTSTASNGVNEITVKRSDGSKNVIYIRNGGKGSDGYSFIGLRYDEGMEKWMQMIDYGGTIVESVVDAPSIYSKEHIDAMLNDYVNALAAKIGGSA